MNRDEFVARYGNIYELSPWVAERAYDGGAGPADPLAPIFRRIVERAGPEAHLTLLRAHPDLAGRIALTPHSTEEQAGAGLDRLSPEAFAEFQRLNTRYTERFGFPFIIAVKGLDADEILRRFRTRVDREPETEMAAALEEVHNIARLRLDADAAPSDAPAPREAVARATLEPLVVAALRRAGMDEANASAHAETMCAAEEAGSESHGIFRLPGVVAALRKGQLNGTAEPRLIDGPDGAVIVDGDNGAASLAYRLGLPVLAERAERLGAAVLAIRNTVHFAAMWHEVEWLAGRNLAAFACTANFPYLAPHGGSRAFFGTNPVAFAFPGPDGPVAFDFAAAAMARGDIMLAARDGREVPAGVGLDASGQATRDPAAILSGAQLPFGEHKGSAIALMVELLAAGVVGDAFSDEAGPRNENQSVPLGGVFVLALSPERIGGPRAIVQAQAFLKRVAAEPGVRLPGARRIRLRREGTLCHVPSPLMATLRELAGAHDNPATP